MANGDMSSARGQGWHGSTMPGSLCAAPAAAPQSDEQADRAFFSHMLADLDEAVPPFGVAAAPAGGIGAHRLALRRDFVARLHGCAAAMGMPVATLFHLAWAMVVARAAARDDVVFGTVLRANTLPLRIIIDDGGVAGAVRFVHRALTELAAHAHASPALIKSCSRLSAPSLLFTSVLVYRDTPSPPHCDAPLMMAVHAGSEVAEIEVRASSPAIPELACAMMATALERLAGALENAPETPACEIDVLPVNVRERLLREWNATECPFPDDRCLHELIEEQVTKTPDATALVDGGRQLTYAELNARANQLAHHLRSSGVGPDARVALFCDRGIEGIVALLATLKAGGAYVPLDPQYPAERLAFMLADIEPLLILSDRAVHAADVPVIDLRRDSWAHLPRTNIDCREVGVGPEHLAYVIYTSGTTGRPKGVMIPHRGLCNLAVRQNELFRAGPGSRVLQFASWSFDAFAWELAMALCNGAALHLPPAGAVQSAHALQETVAREQITHATITPALLAALPEDVELASIATLAMAGEAATAALVARWSKGRQLFNCYGPTETTICLTMHECVAEAGAPPIGRPIGNTRMYLLDPRGRPVPPGVAGEIYAGGVCVARGYWKQSQLTAERFVRDPFVADPAARLYRTGDTARYRADGVIEYLGRSDEQVKVRGFRVEPAEIEAQLLTRAGVRDAIVVARSDIGPQKALVAYVVGEHLAIRPDGLRSYLSERLPGYMVPVAYVALDAFPLTPNGKLDRKALPRPDASAFDESAEELAATETETALASIWAEVLNRESRAIRSSDNFYRLGGDSLLAMVMIHRARRRGIALTMKNVVACRTLRDLAREADGSDDRALADAPPLPVGQPFGLTPIQCWFFEQNFSAAREFSQCQVMTVPEIDEGRLEAALEKVLARHDAFRLRFPSIDGRRCQVYAGDPARPLLVKQVVEGARDPDGAVRTIVMDSLRGLDFERGPLFVAGVVRGHPDRQVRVFIGVHHLICDGLSWRVLLEDLRNCYVHGRVALAAAGTPLSAWRDALETYAHDAHAVDHLAHWVAVKRALREFTTAIEWDDPSRLRGIAQAECHAPLDQVLSLPLDSELHEHRMEILLTAFLLALREQVSATSVALQLESHGREECCGLVPGYGVGWYTALFPAAFELPSNDDLAAAYRAVTEQYGRIPDRGLSYGALRYLHSDPAVRAALSGADSPVLFNYLGTFLNDHHDDGWRMHDDQSGQDVVVPANRRDAFLELNCSVVDDRFLCRLDYATARWSEQGARELMRRFFELARLVCEALTEQDRVDASDGMPRTFPLTPLQEGMLFHEKLAPDSDAYFAQSIWRHASVPDRSRIVAAWTKVVEETDVLRCFFRWEPPGRPKQSVGDNVVPEILWSDISGMDDAAQQTWIDEWLRRDRLHRFDLSKPGLFRVHYIRRRLDCCEMVFSNHHIILDGWSLPLLLGRVHELYADPNHGRGVVSRFGFADFVRYVNAQDAQPARRYFAGRAADADWSIDVPVRQPDMLLDPHDPFSSWSEVCLDLSEEESCAITSYQQSMGITPSTLMMFSLGCVLSAYNEGQRVLFGISLSGRNHDVDGLDSVVGLTINTLPLLFEPRPHERVRAALNELQVQVAQITELSACPLRALDECGQNRFNVVAAFENYPQQDRVVVGALRAELVREIESTGYPLAVVFRFLHERMQIKIIYEDRAFSSASMNRMAGHIRNISLQAVEPCDRNCAALRLVTGAEAAALSMMLRGPAPAHDGKRIEETFGRQAARRPDAIALRHGGRSITYGGLQNVAASLRDLVVQAGVAPGSLVAIVAERTPALVYGMLAVLDAHCAYLPIDADSPPDRNRRILDDAGVDYLLAFDDHAAALTGVELVTVAAGEHGRLLRRRDASLIAPLRDPELAYVMYTSGSTGMPKGVMVRHESVLRLVLQSNYVNLDEQSRLLHTGAPGFDASTFEIWGALLNGGTLCQIGGDLLLDPVEVERVLREERINVLFLTTPLFHRWNDPAMFAPVEQLLVGGEILSPEIAERVRRANPALKLSNVYGPTENTTFSTFHPLDAPLDTRPVPIGRPITGTDCLVLDEHQRLVPEGVPGELHLSGVGLATGYLQQSEATARKFIEVPVALRIGDVQSARVYRTGDRVRIADGGVLEFLGRVDDQVKIRGHRVEPGEVEWHLTRHPGIHDSAVVHVPPPASRAFESGRLVACYVPAYGSMRKDGAAVLEDFLRARVPTVMVPQQYLGVERLPLNANGKVDRAALRVLASQAIERSSSMSGGQTLTAVERIVAEAWQSSLASPVDAESTLYALGGDSLTAVQICTELNRRGYRLAVADLLRSPSVRGSSRYVAVASQHAGDASRCGDHEPLGPSQYRFLRRDFKNPHHFVIPIMLQFKRPVNAEGVLTALEQALSGHDAHRVHFRRDAMTGTLRQVRRQWEPQDYFRVVDLRGHTPGEHDTVVRASAAEACTSLDIWKGPLFRATLFEGCGDDRTLLHLVFHHLISDGVSMSILLRRLQTALKDGRAQPSPPVSYLRWCREFESHYRHWDAQRAREFWEGVLSDVSGPDVRPAHRDMRTCTIVLLDGESSLASLSGVAAASRVRPFAVLLGVFASALHELRLAPPAVHVQTSQREYGSPLSDAPLYETMGYFSAALPFALPAAGDCASLGPSLFSAIECHLSDVFENGRHYLALRYVLPEIDPASHPLDDHCSVMFHYLGEDPLHQSNVLFESAGVDAGPATDADHPSNYLLNVTVTRTAGTLTAALYYSAADYQRQRIEALGECMRAGLRELCDEEIKA